MLAEAWTWVFIGGIFVWVGVCTSLLSRRRRRRHVEANAPLTDADYLQQVGTTDDQAELYLAIREVVAGAGAVPPETIHPSHRMSDVMSLGWDGIDHIDIVFRLEKRFDVKIGKGIDKALRREWDKDSAKDMTFGDYAGCLVRHWDDIIEGNTKSA